ncbi:MAG TPA: bifunctional riboflavin kinase/FMN adenylyltransferase [Phycisphaerae bacterium]|nr:bifunctional riboflavin kinase/FMN adenylyltransferase [Phycisphaerae bacterium]
MEILSDLRLFPAALRGGVLSVGNFDGVHVGHAKMLSTGRAEASRRGVAFTVMTFDPHPAVILRPGEVRQPLTVGSQREELLAGFSPDVVIVVPTTREFLSITAEGFLGGVVRDAIGARVMVEGPTFTFGRGAKGNTEMLKERGAEFGIEGIEVGTEQVALSDLTLVNVSSSLIRWLVSQGRVADAMKCLGRAYTLRGEVVHGAKRGKGIGFPTANVATPQLLPGAGIYAGRARVEGVVYRAAISVGTNPTFRPPPGTLPTVEAFLLDFTGDLYGKRVDVEFHRWIREMLPFGGVEPLVRQMKVDVETTRELIALKERA